MHFSSVQLLLLLLSSERKVQFLSARYGVVAKCVDVVVVAVAVAIVVDVHANDSSDVKASKVAHRFQLTMLIRVFSSTLEHDIHALKHQLVVHFINICSKVVLKQFYSLS